MLRRSHHGDTLGEVAGLFDVEVVHNRADIMPTIQIGDVPNDVYLRLEDRAKQAGLSLNQFLLDRLEEIVQLPTVRELAKRIQRREAHRGRSSAKLIREDRDNR